MFSPALHAAGGRAPGPAPPFAPSYPGIGPNHSVPNYGNIGAFGTKNDAGDVTQPIQFSFGRPLADRGLAERTIGIRTEPGVAGNFYWGQRPRTTLATTKISDLRTPR